MLEIGTILTDKEGSQYKVMGTNNGFNNYWLGLKKCNYELKIVKYDRRPEMIGHEFETSQENISTCCNVSIEKL